MTPSSESHSPSSEYLRKRKLIPPFIGPYSLAGFMIGCTTSSMFFGWQPGLSFGFGNMVVALVLSTIMYTILLISVSEMCTALPFTSGLSTFAQAAFNPEMFAFSGALHTISFILYPAMLLFALGETLCVMLPSIAFLKSDKFSVFAYWLLISSLSVSLHFRPRILFKVILVLAIYCSMLIAIYISIATFIKPPLPMNHDLAASHEQTGWSGLSISGIMCSFPFACSFYIGVESFPSTSDEAKKIFKTAPRVAKCCLSLLVIFSVGLIATYPDQYRPCCGNLNDATSNPKVFNVTSDTCLEFPSISPPCSGFSPPPRLIFPIKHFMLDNALTLVCSILSPRPQWCEENSQWTNNENSRRNSHVKTGLIALTVLPPVFLSFITATYVSARHIYFLSRSGILPASISQTHSGAPILATCTSLVLAVFTIGVMCIMNEIPYLMRPIMSPNARVISNAALSELSAPSVNLNVPFPIFGLQTLIMFVHSYLWVSGLTYLVKFGTFVALRMRVPHLPRPFVSPFGIIGASIGLSICLVFGIVGPFVFGPLFYGTLLAIVAMFTVLGSLYWVFVAKVRVANNPEKIFIRHQLQQLWGRANSVQHNQNHDRNEQGNELLVNSNLCTTTFPVISIGIPFPLAARIGAPFRNNSSQWQPYINNPCSTTVLVNSEGLTDQFAE